MVTRSKCVASVTFLLTVVVVAIVQAADITQVAVRQYSCRTIYHSPQTPGYTCWAGIWKMPDASLMVAFTQVTGPLEGWHSMRRGKSCSDCRPRSRTFPPMT